MLHYVCVFGNLNNGRFNEKPSLAVDNFTTNEDLPALFLDLLETLCVDINRHLRMERATESFRVQGVSDTYRGVGLD